MKKIHKTPFAAAMGVAVISTFATSGANAEANPFGVSELSQGYMQVAEAEKAGEMACGAGMKMEKPKAPDAVTTANKKIDAAKVAAEAKVGEKKCAPVMKTPETKVTKEAK